MCSGHRWMRRWIQCGSKAGGEEEGREIFYFTTLILSPRNHPESFAFVNERGLYLRWRQNAETSDAVRRTPSRIDTLSYGSPTFAPSFNGPLREPRRLSCRGCGFCSDTHRFSLSLPRSRAPRRPSRPLVEIGAGIFRCLLASISALLVESCRVDVMDPIRLTRDPNSTRVLDPLDRKIRRNRVCSNREGGIGTRNCFARSFAGTLRRRGKVLRCRSALRCSRKMGWGGRCWLGFNLCAAQPKALLVVAG